jgi:hypothetical protein
MHAYTEPNCIAWRAAWFLHIKSLVDWEELLGILRKSSVRRFHNRASGRERGVE